MDEHARSFKRWKDVLFYNSERTQAVVPKRLPRTVFFCLASRRRPKGPFPFQTQNPLRGHGENREHEAAPLFRPAVFTAARTQLAVFGRLTHLFGGLTACLARRALRIPAKTANNPDCCSRAHWANRPVPSGNGHAAGSTPGRPSKPRFQERRPAGRFARPLKPADFAARVLQTWGASGRLYKTTCRELRPPKNVAGTNPSHELFYDNVPQSLVLSNRAACGALETA